MPQCAGYVNDKNTGAIRRCRSISRDEFCHNHDKQCRGYKLDGVKCIRLGKQGYLYCCADHDPVHRATYLDPNDLRLENVRQLRKEDVVQRYDSQDPYNLVELPSQLDGYHLDHQFELQCATYAIRQCELADRDMVVEVLRDNALNKSKNLCFTQATTNEIKGAAVRNFLDDSLTGHRRDKTFTSYLVKGDFKGRRVDREVTGRIRKEMTKAAKYCVRKLEDESETPDLERIQRRLENLRVEMTK